MGKSSSPTAPNPYQSAEAQYTYGTAAANYNQGLNSVDSVTPYGSTTWSVNSNGVPGASSPAGGSYSSGSTGLPSWEQPTPQPIDHALAGNSATATGSNGTGSNGLPQLPGYNPYSVTQIPSGLLPAGPNASSGYYQPSPAPQYTQTTTLSPEQQQILNNSQANQITQGQLEHEASGAVNPGGPQLQTQVPGSQNLQGMYQQGFNTALAGNEAAIMPVLNNQQEQLDASLRNSGATPGTPAYDNAMSAFGSQESNALTQAAGSAENTGLNLENSMFGQNLQGAEFGNQAAVEQNQIPLQNFLSLGGGGATLPGSTSGSGAGTSAPNIMQAFQNQYQGQLDAYNASTATNNSLWSDLGTLGAAALMAAPYAAAA